MGAVAVAVAGAGAGEILPREARRTLRELGAGCGLEVLPLSGAMSNQVFEVKWRESAGGGCRKVLLRIYGASGGGAAFFDREEEAWTFEEVSRRGQGPALLARFPTGRVEEFIHARTLSAADLRDPEISALIASKLREFHELDIPRPKVPQIWTRLRNWLKTARAVCPGEEAAEFGLESMEKEIAALEKELSGVPQRVRFCHNDLQYGNVMIGGDDGRSVTIIDYEYASFNPVAFDIANHFCEMAADYHLPQPHLLDYSKYPGIGEQRRFLQAYLQSSSSGDAEDEEVESLLKNIEKYTLASHLVWGLWGIISEHINGIEFDYKEYARQRFEQYWMNKQRILQPLSQQPVLSRWMVSAGEKNQCSDDVPACCNQFSPLPPAVLQITTCCRE